MTDLYRFVSPELGSVEHSAHSVEWNFPSYSQLPLDQIPHLLLSGVGVLVLLIRLDGNSVEYEIVLPALVYLIQSVLYVIIRHNQAFNLSLCRFIIPVLTCVVTKILKSNQAIFYFVATELMGDL